MSAMNRTPVFCAILFAGVLAMPVASASAQTFGTTPQYAPQADQPGDVAADDVPAQLRRQVVEYPVNEPPGTIIIDTPHTYLYLTLGGGKAMRYGIGVGRQGFTWSGTETIVRKAEWPDWIPPVEMVARQPYLPRFVGGGPGNPLGARALYLGNTDYRIHGTNDPSSIGKHMSSGCIRLLNADVIDLYSRVGIGTKVVVLPNNQGQASVDDGRRVTIQNNSGGPMMARIAVTAPAGAGPAGVY
jgi:lipoprotein-anchoring transpeptidase ErfK/SrfK